jgi:hypothetical protein
MSQDVQTNHSVSEPLAESIPHQPWVADTYANELMDELFSDIDRILDGSSKLPTEPVKPEYVALQPLKIPEITMPPALIQSEALVSQQLANPENLAKTPKDKSRSVKSRTQNRGWGRWFDKLLLAVTVASVGALLILWLAKSQKLNWLTNLNPAFAPGNQAAQLSQSDVQFINYMLRSLDVIDRKAQVSKQQASVANGQPTNANNLAVVPNRPPTVLERVYIPVYPPAQLPYIPQASLPAPARPAPQTNFKASPQSKSVAPAQKVLPTQPKSLASSRVALPPLQTRPSVKLPPLQAPARVALPPLQLPTQAEPAPQHTLVGVLELGDRSAALFEVNGITQRIRVGEGIGTTGWALVTVANQEAIIRRNGEVRSIYVGQKF